MSRFEKWSVWITSVLTGITGVVYLWMKYFVASTDPFAVVNHPLQPWFLKAHILVSPFLLLAFGMIFIRHVWQHFRNRVTWGRKSGILTALLFLPMVVTGYLIQSVTGQGWLEVLAITHIVAGCVYLLGLAAHQLAIYFLRPPPGRRRLYALERRRKRVGRKDDPEDSDDPEDPAASEDSDEAGVDSPAPGREGTRHGTEAEKSGDRGRPVPVER